LAWLVSLSLFFTACFLVATQPLSPVPLSRSAVLAVAGATITGLSVHAMIELHGRTLANSRSFGAFYPAAVGAGMVMIAAVDVRQHLLLRTDAARRRALGQWAREQEEIDPDISLSDQTGIVRKSE
jgi:hypothetical protein